MLFVNPNDNLVFPQKLSFDSGSVNPVSGKTVPERQIQHEIFSGMTLRDYFAAAALTGILSSTLLSAKNDEMATFAYDMADAMLLERLKVK